jgi:hypothetical protein
MICRSAAVGLSLLSLLSLASGPARCSDAPVRPLQLALTSSYASSARNITGRPSHVSTHDFQVVAPAMQNPVAPPAQSSIAPPAQSSLASAQRSLKRRALNSLLNAPEPVVETSYAENGQSDFNLRFERQGTAARDVSRGYKQMCVNLSHKIWDEPNGRQIRFDVAGKPGIAFEFPTH